MSTEYKTGTVRTVTTTVVDVDGLHGLFSLPITPFTPEPVDEVHVFEREGILRYWWVSRPDYMVEETEVLELYGVTEIPKSFGYFTREDYEDLVANRGRCHVVGMNRGRFLTVEETHKLGVAEDVERLFRVNNDYVHSKGIDYHMEQLQHDYDAWSVANVFELVCVAVDVETGAYECVSGGLYYGWESLVGVAGYAAELCEDMAGEVEWQKNNKKGEVA